MRTAILFLTRNTFGAVALILINILCLDTIVSAQSADTPDFKILKSVVNLKSVSGAQGVGTYLDSNRILTAAHVVMNDTGPFDTLSRFPRKSMLHLLGADGKTIELKPEDYLMLIDPEMSINTNFSGSKNTIVPLRNDIAIIEITNPTLEAKLPKTGFAKFGTQPVGAGEVLTSVTQEFKTSQSLVLKSQEDKIWALGEIAKKTKAGDSGGPVFTMDPETGEETIVAIQHAIRPIPGNTTGQEVVHQIVNPADFSRLLDPASQEWRDKVSGRVFQLLEELTDREVEDILSEFRNSRGVRALTIERVGRRLQHDAMWGLSEEEAREMARNLWGAAARSNEKRDPKIFRDKLKTLTVKYRPPGLGCPEKFSKILRTLPPPQNASNF